MAPFCSNAAFLVRYDWRWVGKQILDNNSAATEVQCLSSPVVTAFLTEASEMVMSAAAVGDRYNTQKNPSLPPIANDLAVYGGTLLTRIVSDLTMGLILKRRARGAKDEEALGLPYVQALEYLEQMRQGERIFFMVPGVPEAGLPAHAPLSAPLGYHGPELISNNSRIFGSIGFNRNYGIAGPGYGGECR